jgi:hypothetical protein
MSRRRGPGFAPGVVSVGFVVDRVAMEQVFFRVIQCSSVDVIPPLLPSHSCIIWGMDNVPLTATVLQSHSPTAF